jgi:hypothetical protein
MSLYVSLPLAVLAWLLLTRLPVDGAAVLGLAAAWGVVFGTVIRRWVAGPLLFAAAVAGDIFALVLGWFLFLTDFWFVPPLVGAVAGMLAGLLLQVRRFGGHITQRPRTGQRADR